MVHILKCEMCGDYGLSKVCACGGTRVFVKPAKFSIDDKYGKYRRKAREAQHVEDNDS